MSLLFGHISSLQGMILLIFLLTSGFSESKPTRTLIYDWGNGASAEAYNRIIDRYGKSLIEKYKK